MIQFVYILLNKETKAGQVELKRYEERRTHPANNNANKHRNIDKEMKHKYKSRITETKPPTQKTTIEQGNAALKTQHINHTSMESTVFAFLVYYTLNKRSVMVCFILCVMCVCFIK